MKEYEELMENYEVAMAELEVLYDQRIQSVETTGGTTDYDGRNHLLYY